MTGFSTSDEMSTVAGKVNGEIGPIGDEASAIGKSHVSAGDGGRDFQDKATAYITALNNNVVASIKAYGTATTQLGDRLTSTYQQYSNTESNNTGNVSKSGGNL